MQRTKLKRLYRALGSAEIARDVTNAPRIFFCETHPDNTALIRRELVDETEQPREVLRFSERCLFRCSLRLFAALQKREAGYPDC